MIRVYLTNGTVVKLEGEATWEWSTTEDYLLCKCDNRDVGFPLRFVVFWDVINDDDDAEDEELTGKLTIVSPPKT